MIVYIAGKISGLPYNEVLKKFGEAQTKLENQGHIVLNPTVLPWGMPRDRYMPICMAMLLQADMIYVLSDAKQSEGALIEKCLALYQGKKVEFQDAYWDPA